MAKTLELLFVTETGKPARMTIDHPKEPIDQAAVKQSMQQIIDAGVFNTANGNFASVQGARIIERNITEYELA